MVNKIVITAFIILMIGTNSFGQKSGFGIRGGANYYNSSVSDIFSGSSKISGANGAIFFDLGVTKVFSIQPEFKLGQNETNLVIDTLTDESIRETGIIANKIEIPILAKLKFGSQVFKINLFAGPNFGFSLSKFTEERLTNQNMKTQSSKTDIDKKDYDTFDYSNLAGFGLSMHLNNWALFADYRYTFDLRKLSSIRQAGLVNGLGGELGSGIIYYW